LKQDKNRLNSKPEVIQVVGNGGKELSGYGGSEDNSQILDICSTD
jgi:hypothetical protein